jgi:TolB-like protein
VKTSRVLGLYYVAVFLLITVPFYNPLSAQKTTLAVVDFEGFGISQTESIALTNRLRNELFRQGTFRVVDRGLMEEIIQEQDLQQSGCASNECLVRVGRLLGVQEMIGGSISLVGGIYTVSARLIDVETGEMLGVSDFDLRGELGDMLTTGMAQVAALLSTDQEEIGAALDTAKSESEEKSDLIQNQIEPEKDISNIETSAPFSARFQLGYGIPLDCEKGLAIWGSWFPSKRRSIGNVSIRPILSGGHFFVVDDDSTIVDEGERWLGVEYESIEQTIYYIMPGVNIRYQGQRIGFGGSLGIGYGSGFGSIEERRVDREYDDGEWYVWNESYTDRNVNHGGLVFSIGTQLTYRIGKSHIFLQLDLFSNPGADLVTVNLGLQR